MRGDILDCVDCESLPDSPPKWVICTNGLTYQGPIANSTRSHDHTTLNWTSREMRACMIIKRQKFTTSLLCPNQGTDRQKKVLSSRHLRIDRNCKSETPVYMILYPQRACSCHLSHCIVNFEICNSICKWWKNNANSK